MQKAEDWKARMKIAKGLKIPQSTVSNSISATKTQRTCLTKKWKAMFITFQKQNQDHPRKNQTLPKRINAQIIIDKISVRNIVKKALGLKSVMFQIAHVLTDAMKQQQLKKCRALLKHLASGSHRVVLW